MAEQDNTSDSGEAKFQQAGENRLKYVPYFSKSFDRNVLVTPTNHYSRLQTETGIIFSGADNTQLEKKYDVGVALSVGDTVSREMGIKNGDILIWQTAKAFRLPNGIETASLFRLMADTSTVVAILPNPDVPESWDRFGLTDLEKSYLTLCTEKAAHCSIPLKPFFGESDLNEQLKEYEEWSKENPMRGASSRPIQESIAASTNRDLD